MINKNTFAVIRHGETANNKENKNRGFLDIPLNSAGRQDAKWIATQIKKEKLDGLISSPLKRARETASIISKENKTPILGVYRGLLPWDLGSLEGKDIKETLPILHKYMDTPNKTLPKGESFNKFKMRATIALNQIHKKYPDKKLGLVTHHRVERLVHAITDEAGGKGNFHLPIQKTKGIDPANYKMHKWEDMKPKGK